MTSRICILTLVIAVLLSFFPGILWAEEIEMLNRPVNSSGLTGLFITTSPFTLAAGTIETGIIAFSENSNKPDFTLTEYSAIVAAGIRKSMELAVKGSYFHREEGTGPKLRGAGDTEVSLKWNARQQIEDSPLPSIAFFLTGLAPTSSDDKGFSRVQHWGSRAGISVGSEILWEDHVFGLYADAQVAFQDLSDESRRDIYHIVNAGLLLPISKYRNLQLILEYNLVSGRDVQGIDPMDYSAVTSGVRLVTERFNLSMGMQLLHKEKVAPLLDDSSRVIAIMSMKF